MRKDGRSTSCLKTMCPNETGHKSGYCTACRQFSCPRCGKEHIVIEAPHSLKLRYCADCRRRKEKDGGPA